MRFKTSYLLGAVGTSLVLVAAPLPFSVVSAHWCESLETIHPQNKDPNTGCDGGSCPCERAPHDHKNTLTFRHCTHPGPDCCPRRRGGGKEGKQEVHAEGSGDDGSALRAAAGDPEEALPEDRILLCNGLGPGTAGAADNCPHSSPHSHYYGSAASAGARSGAAQASRSAGAVTVHETNAVDCDGDGVPGDFDGDYDTGVGGAFFGHGTWADEAICGYTLTVHSATVTVTDVVFGNDVQFVIGADDTSGPVISTDPVTGETTCETDGRITPGNPNTDPTRDADDCLTPVIDGGSTNGQGTTCGAGGDGGYWVFLMGAHASEDGTGLLAANTPSSGAITA